MRVQHNISAMNSYRNYNTNTSMINKNLEKLSSGYKINRAGDDAAGLAISEKMRAQITGLETAQKNAKDGISLIQTAEGALTEVHSMLNRMYQLAEQSANGTYTDGTMSGVSSSDAIDRGQLQKEVDQLRQEIGRIAQTSNFNGRPLFNVGGYTASVDGDITAAGSGITAVAVNLASGVEDADATGLDGATFTIANNNDLETYDKVTLDKSGYTATLSGSTITVKKGTDDVATLTLTGFTPGGYKDAQSNASFKIKVTQGDDSGVKLQIGADGSTSNQLTVTAMDMQEATLQIDSASVDISTQDKALDSLDNIRAAINKVSDYRGEMGAMQNRLEHTINNLSTMQENIQDAESTIRDTDVASEMMKYTKNSILVQSAQAMLAQANQQPQGVLQLLQ